MNYRYAVTVPYMPMCITALDMKEIGKLIAERDPSLYWQPLELKPSEGRFRLGEYRLPKVPSMMLQFHMFPAQNEIIPEFRGPRLEANPIHKAIQLRMLEKAGIEVPPWTRLERKTELDPDIFGDYVLVKPTEHGASFGRGIVLLRTSEFPAYRDEHARTYEQPGRSPPIVQKFVYTGEKPASWRVVTFLGKVVHSRYQEIEDKTPFNAPTTRLLLQDKIATNTEGVVRDGWLKKDEIVNDIARKVSSLFPTPVLATDIIKAHDSDEYLVLEVNMGDCWLFSSRLGEKHRVRFGADAVRAQYDVASTAADAIIEEARSRLLAGSPA